MEDLSHQVEAAHASLQQKRKVTSRLTQLQVDLAESQTQEVELRKVLDKEFDDIVKLENSSLHSLFSQVLGNKEERLEIERQEYLHALLNHEAISHHIEELIFEQNVLNKQLLELVHIDQEYEKLLVKKEAALRTEGKYQAELMILDQKILNRKAQLKEISEALIEGKQVQGNLEILDEGLGKLKKWGIPEGGLGGKGRYSSLKKKHFIRETKEVVQLINGQLSKFHAELADIYRSLNYSFKDHFNHANEFLDLFYNNLITDWVVQRNLKTTRSSLENMQHEIKRVLMSLAHEEKTMHEEILKLDADREILLVKAS